MATNALSKIGIKCGAIERSKSQMTRWMSILLLGAGFALANPADLDRARKLFAHAQYREVIAALAPQSNTGGAPVLELIGKSYFMTGDFKKSAEFFERAVNADSDSSTLHHWLGKAYGRRAETSNPLFAPGLASKARQSFEKAVALDGKNIEAINDLFSYYLEAPGFLGGGLDKAAQLASRIEAVDPIEYQYAMAQLASKRKEFNQAEMHLRRAADLAPRQVGRIIDLARFLSERGKHQESETVFARAEKVAPNTPRLLFERANNYIRAKKNLDEAKALLERYLRSPLSPDDPPRAEAEKLLKQAGA
jgi:tetratricopeptide (TPR) repeat protein